MSPFSLPPLFWVVAGLGLALLLAVAWRRSLRWRPAWLLRAALLTAAMAGAFLPETRATVDAPPRREILIIDQSDSLSPEARGLARAQARLWVDAGSNRLVLAAGAETAAAPGEDIPAVPAVSTDLAGAIDQARTLIGDRPGRIILATDGHPGDMLAFQRAVESLAAGPASVTLEMIPLEAYAFPADLYAGRLYLPSAMWEHSPFTAILPVTTFLAGDVRLVVSVNEIETLDTTFNLPAGRHLVPISLQTASSEIMTISVEISAQGDPRPENNRAEAALRVFPAPRVLVLTRDAGVAGAFGQALSGVGLDADLMVPEDFPDSLSALGVYQVIVVENILASDLTEAQMRTMKDFVQQLGRGLVFTGGRSAFTLGGYRDTILEPMMPVRLEPPPRDQNSPLTLVLVLDRSASMDGPRGTPQNLRPISLAREAAVRSVETLGPEDYLGVLTYNTNPVWTISVSSAGSGDILQQAKDAMAALSPSGGTAIFTALNAAVTQLIDHPTTETRHIVLLSDGNDETPLSDYAALAELAAEDGITISTIALGVEADRELMAFLAEAGRGRYYAVQEAVDLPKILIDESRAARDENVHEGAVQAVPGEGGHPVLSGLTTATMPPFQGYNALESKADDGAEDVLRSASFEDPLLSVWQYGLGRVAAWTGDLGREWNRDFPAWEGWGPLWSNIIRYALPDPALGPGQVSVDVGPLEMAVSARIRTDGGALRSGVPVSFAMVGPDGEVRAYPVPQTAPGQYDLTLPRPPEGVYRAVLRYEDEDGLPVEIAAPVAVNYPEEWQPAGGDPVFTAGELTTWDALLETGASPGEVTLAPNRILQRLVLALLLLWPVEIWIRRRWMPWR